MTLARFLVFLHVTSAFAFVAGVVGRDILLGQARNASDIDRIADLVESAGPFERYLAIPGSIVVLVFGVLVWWQQDLPVWGDGSRWVTVSLLLYLSVIPLVPLVLIPRGKVFEAALASAIGSASVTPELTTALHDPYVGLARWYELAVVAVVILLMVTKPF